MGDAETINVADAIRRRLDSRPFVPFTIVLADGRRHVVTDPMGVAMGGDTIVVVPASGMESFRKTAVVTVEVNAEAASSDAGGIDLGEVLMQKRRAKPFNPYTIVTKDGRRFPIVRALQAGYINGLVLLVPPRGDTKTVLKRDELAAIESE